MYEVHIIRLSEETCLWVLKDFNQRVIAKSTLVGPISVIRAEAESISHQIGAGGAVTIEGEVEKKE